MEAAREILPREAKAARWIALSASRELESVAVQRRLRRAEQLSQEEDSSEPTYRSPTAVSWSLTR
jgi:hypothetical protein